MEIQNNNIAGEGNCQNKDIETHLNKKELEGVITHEMSHIQNHDTLVATVIVGIVVAIALMGEIFLRMLFWCSGGGRKGRHPAIYIIANPFKRALRNSIWSTYLPV